MKFVKFVFDKNKLEAKSLHGQELTCASFGKLFIECFQAIKENEINTDSLLEVLKSIFFNDS